jgi:hypothetical protein
MLELQTILDKLSNQDLAVAGRLQQIIATLNDVYCIFVAGIATLEGVSAADLDRQCELLATLDQAAEQLHAHHFDDCGLLPLNCEVK